MSETPEAPRGLAEQSFCFADTARHRAVGPVASLDDYALGPAQRQCVGNG